MVLSLTLRTSLFNCLLMCILPPLQTEKGGRDIYGLGKLSTFWLNFLSCWSKYVIATWSWRTHCWMVVPPLVWRYVILDIPRYNGFFDDGYSRSLLCSYGCLLTWLFPLCCYCSLLDCYQSSLLHSQPKSTVGTPAYIAPEVLLRQEYDGKVKLTFVSRIFWWIDQILHVYSVWSHNYYYSFFVSTGSCMKIITWYFLAVSWYMTLMALIVSVDFISLFCWRFYCMFFSV